MPFEFLKDWLRPYKYALFRFLTLLLLYWRRLIGSQTEPVIRHISLDSRRYLAQKLEPRELAEAYMPIDSAQPFCPPPAKTIGQTRLTAPPYYKYREMFVVHLEEVRVLGEPGHVLTRDDVLLADISFRNPALCYADGSWADLFGTAGPAKELDGSTCLLASNWTGVNYFHFLFELLPRCEMLRRSGVDFDTIDHFIVNRLNEEVYWQGLNECGIPRARAVLAEASSTFCVQHLIAPSTLRGTGHMRRWACEWLKATFAPKTRTRRSPVRLFVGRDDANRRRLINQSEILEPVLAPLGFEPVRWEGGSIREQAAVFAEADVVVGVNGAALSNLVFCAPGTRVIVIHHPTYLSRYFYELSHTRGLDYYYLVGQTSEQIKPQDWNHDYSVDPDALAAMLKFAGVN